MTNPDLARRLLDALVGKISARWPEYLHSRFTVAEIYQNLVPRAHREEMGISGSAEYEQALLRLLSGEGGYLKLDSEAARDEIRAELASRFPNTGIYRDFAAVGVRLNPRRLPRAARETPRDGKQQQNGSGSEAGAGLGTEQKPDSEARPAPALHASVEAAAPPKAEERPSCSGCNRELPEMESVRFCPYCGQDIRVVACTECGMRVEADWSYCVGCGTRARRS